MRRRSSKFAAGGAQKQHKFCGCPVGRPFNIEHPTCKTCPIDCSASKKSGATEAPPRTWHEGQILFTTAYLFSYNHWHGRPRYIYMLQKQKWKAVFEGIWALWGKQKDTKRKITVVRQVTQESNFIMDDDNLMTSLKPVLDSLKLQGVIIDDASRYVQVDKPVQVIGASEVIMVTVTNMNEPIGDPPARKIAAKAEKIAVEDSLNLRKRTKKSKKVSAVAN